MSDFGGKNYKIRFRLGLRPRPYMGKLTSYSAPPSDPWLHLRGPTSKGRGGKVNEGEKEGRKRSLGLPIFTTDRRPCYTALTPNKCRHVGRHVRVLPSIRGLADRV